MESHEKEFNLNSTYLLRLLWEQRKLVVTISIAALVISTVVAFLIPERYLATATLYPVKSSQQSKDVFGTAIAVKEGEGLTVFGEDEEAEQLLQILSSETLCDIVIAKHNLMVNWGIDPNDRHARYRVHRMFDYIVSFRPTQYQSVQIGVEDYTPQASAAIANTIVDVADSLMRAAKGQIAKRALAALEEQHLVARGEMQTLEDSLTAIMQHGVINFEAQTDRYHKAYAEALLNGNARGAQAIADRLAAIAPYGSRYLSLTKELDLKVQQLALIGENLKLLQVEASESIPSQVIVDRASVPDKKTFPKKSLVIVVSTLSVLFFLIFVLVLAEFFRKSLRK